MPIQPLQLLNIQEKDKNLNTRSFTDAHLKLKEEAAIRQLIQVLDSGSPLSAVFQALIRRVKHPGAPYSDQDLRLLLLVSVAEERRKRMVK